MISLPSIDFIDSFSDVAGVLISLVIVYISVVALTTWRDEKEFGAFFDCRTSCLKEILTLERHLIACFGSRYVHIGLNDIEYLRKSEFDEFDWERMQIVLQSIINADRAFECWCKIKEIALFLSDQKNAELESKLRNILAIIDRAKSKSVHIIDIYKLKVSRSEVESENLNYLFDKDHQSRDDVNLKIKEIFLFMNYLTISDTSFKRTYFLK